MKYLLDADSVIDYFANRPGALAHFPRDFSDIPYLKLLDPRTG